MSAEYQVNGAVAVITLANPPVNGLGLATRTAAVAGIRQALGIAVPDHLIKPGNQRGSDCHQTYFSAKFLMRIRGERVQEFQTGAARAHSRLFGNLGRLGEGRVRLMDRPKRP